MLPRLGSCAAARLHAAAPHRRWGCGRLPPQRRHWQGCIRLPSAIRPSEPSTRLADGGAQAALHDADGRLRLKRRHIVLLRGGTQQARAAGQLEGHWATRGRGGSACKLRYQSEHKAFMPPASALLQLLDGLPASPIPTATSLQTSPHSHPQQTIHMAAPSTCSFSSSLINSWDSTSTRVENCWPAGRPGGAVAGAAGCDMFEAAQSCRSGVQLREQRHPNSCESSR